MTTKTRATVSLSPRVWRLLDDYARVEGLMHNNKPNRSAAIERIASVHAHATAYTVQVAPSEAVLCGPYPFHTMEIRYAHQQDGNRGP